MNQLFGYRSLLVGAPGKPNPIVIAYASMRTTNGTQTITVPETVALNQKPIAAMFGVSGSTGGLWDGGGFIGIGFSDGANDRAYAAVDVDGQTTTTSYSAGDRSDCIKLIGGSGGDVLEANVSQFVENGVELNVTNIGGQAYQVSVILFFDENGQAVVSNFDPANIAGNTVTVTPGISSDLIIPIHVFRENLGTTSGFALQSLGFVVPGGNQHSFYWNSEGGVTTSNVQAYLRSGYGAFFEGTTTRYGFEFSNFTATGFDVTTRINGADSDDRLYYLALEMPDANFDCRVVSTPTSPVTQDETGMGFRALTGLFVTTMVQTLNAQITNTNAECFGFGAIGEAEEQSGEVIVSEDGVGTSDTESRSLPTKVFANKADFSADQGMNFKKSLEDGMRLNFLQGIAASKKWIGLFAGD